MKIIKTYIMKNIHLIPTDKPSRLFYLASNLHIEKGQLIAPKNYKNIYITSDEEIKEGDWCFDIELNKIEKCQYSGIFKNWKKIILTTDQDLIADGVQAIDDEFLEWFVKNPSCEKISFEVTRERNGYSSKHKKWYKINCK